MPSRNQLIATGVTAAVVGGFVGYVAWFDYKRRNDASFRRKLKKEHKKVFASAEREEKERKARNTALLKANLIAITKEPLPEAPEEKEAYFMQMVAMGEGLATAGPESEVQAALSFYRALRVYPSPVELIMIYQKTVPAPIFALLMELTSLDIGGDNEPDATPAPPRAPVEDSKPAPTPAPAPAAAEATPSPVEPETTGSGSGTSGTDSQWETLTEEGKAAKAAEAAAASAEVVDVEVDVKVEAGEAETEAEAEEVAEEVAEAVAEVAAEALAEEEAEEEDDDEDEEEEEEELSEEERAARARAIDEQVEELAAEIERAVDEAAAEKKAEEEAAANN